MSRRTKFPTVPIQEVPVQEVLKEAIANRPVVLVIDDESVVTDTLAEILDRGSYAAIPVHDAEEVLETALVMPPELLLTNVVPPGMSGIELAIKVKRIFPDCRILLFRAGGDGVADIGKPGGHRFDLLTKPIHPNDLLSQISASLRPRKAQPG